ncbi:MAG: hypothetical protein JW808_04160 [Victivallales bacterium]|nr:hypothetical protein [Victivallales bacterium]
MKLAALCGRLELVMDMLRFGYVLALLASAALAPSLLMCCRALFFTFLSMFPRRRAFSAAPIARIAIVLKVCDLEGRIERMVSELISGLDYDHKLFDVVVVADGCRDSTAFLAGFAGARVLEVNDRPGLTKINALEWAFGQLLEEAGYDAFLVIEPGTVLDDTTLRALDRALARGSKAVQLASAPINAKLSWRECLSSIHFASATHVMPRGRSMLGLSCGILGNGFCLTAEILREIPYRGAGHSFAECLEYHLGIILGGEKVRYMAHPAFIPPDYLDYILRWKLHERSKMGVSRYHLKNLVKSAASANLQALDSVLDLMLPSVGGTVVALTVSLFAGGLLFIAGDRLRGCEELFIPGLAVSGLSLSGLLMLPFRPLAALLEKGLPFKCWIAFLALPLYPPWCLLLTWRKRSSCMVFLFFLWFFSTLHPGAC